MKSWMLAGLMAAVSAGASVAAEIRIVVNVGSYASAGEAAGDEANVGWDDGDAGDDVICTECFAAVELQRYLRKLAGRAGDGRFAIVDDGSVPAESGLVLVGNPRTNEAVAEWAPRLGLSADAFERLGREGYLIKSARVGGDRQVTIVGGRGRVGTLYGVYGLLDRLGVRWFAPTEIGEEVPAGGIDELPAFDVTDGPAFQTRGFHAWEERGNPEFFDWMARNRMNYWCVEAKDRAGLKKRGIKMNCGNHVITYQFLGPRLRYPYDHPTFDGDEDLPGDPYPVSEALAGDTDKNGELSYGEAHPEWYGLRDGRRSFRIHGDGGDNICTSNRWAVDELMKRLVGDLIDGTWKDADSLNFWTLDGGRWRQCEPCGALGTPTDRNLLLVHRCRQEIKRAMAAGRLHRDVMVYFLAYADVLSPPTRPLPADFDYDSCVATFFPIRRCYVHTMSDPTCTEDNARYRRHLDGWATDPNRHYRGQIFIGEYYNLSGYKCLPMTFARTMSADLPYYHGKGARHMHYMHCTAKNWGTKTLTNYQFAKMLWDPRLDVDGLLADYFAKRYGPTADVMRRLYDRLDIALSNVTELKYFLSSRLRANSSNLFPRRHMKYEATRFEKDDGPDLTEMVAAIDECQALLAEARSTSAPARIQARLAEDRGPLEYAANTLHLYDALVRMTRLCQAGKQDEAAKLVSELKRYGEALENDTVNMKWSSSHGNAANGLAASNVANAYHRLLLALAPLDPAAVKEFDPAGPLIVYGQDMRGGGRLKYGRGFQLNPSRAGTKYCKRGNYIYAKNNATFSFVLAAVRLGAIPPDGLELTLVGMSVPVGGEGKPGVPIRITVNDKEIFAGEGHFPEGSLTAARYTVPADLLRVGVNRIRIANTAPQGPTGNRPWFGIDRIELRAKLIPSPGLAPKR